MGKIIVLIILLWESLFLYPQIFGEVKAQSITISPEVLTNKDSGGVQVDIINLPPTKNFVVRGSKNSLRAEVNIIWRDGLQGAGYGPPNPDGTISFHLCNGGSNNSLSWTVANDCRSITFQEDVYYIKVYELDNNDNPFVNGFFKVISETKGIIEFLNTSFSTTNEIIIKVSDINDGSYKILVDGKDPDKGGPCIEARNGSFTVNIGYYREGSHNIQIYTNQSGTISHPLCGLGSIVTYRSFTISNIPGAPPGPGPIVGPGVTSPAGTITIKQCKSKDDPSFNPNTDMVCSLAGGESCDEANIKERGPAFKTAIGCIHTSPAELVKDLMKFVVGIGGGLAFLMMLLGAFQMLTSAGNPETLNAGKDRLTSAVIGLLLVIFSILLLQIIGVGILNLPEFGK